MKTFCKQAPSVIHMEYSLLHLVWLMANDTRFLNDRLLKLSYSISSNTGIYESLGSPPARFSEMFSYFPVVVKLVLGSIIFRY